MLAWSLVVSGHVAMAVPARQAEVERVFARNEITILVTDSGLGGLAVAAELESGLRTARAFSRVTVVFANALPDVEKTYNAMATRRERVATFDRALEGMTRWYKPDIILVACNTLSVLIPDTRFAREGHVPIVGIISAGVQPLTDRLKADQSALALVLGTPTTIGSGDHRSGLQAAGIAPDRVHEQACPNLETEIQADPASDMVRGLIEAYVDEAWRTLGDRSTRPMVVALCCSHYGYSRALFQEILSRQFGQTVVIVDPNVEMSRSLLAHARRNAFGVTETNVQVVSRAAVTVQEREAIAGAVEGISRKAAAALRSYERKMDLFQIPQ
jgi:glutamate racemase